MTVTITSEPNARPEDLAVVKAGLLAYNESHVGDPKPGEINLLVRNDAGEVVGGLIGSWRWDWLYLDKLWVREDMRGQDIGSRLLLRAEEEARAAGCTTSVLDTFAFQARPFYEKHGYRVFGTLEDYPCGRGMFFLRKELTGATEG